jgi:hypothetical protein
MITYEGDRLSEMSEWMNGVHQLLLTVLWRLLLLRPHGRGMRWRKGSTEYNPMSVRVILTEFDSSSQTYRSTWVSRETAPAMRENSPMVRDEGDRLLRDEREHLQCSITQTHDGLAP